ncbi:hypothetical protein H8959_013583 [Pygathrix nigripes]
MVTLAPLTPRSLKVQIALMASFGSAHSGGEREVKALALLLELGCHCPAGGSNHQQTPLPPGAWADWLGLTKDPFFLGWCPGGTGTAALCSPTLQKREDLDLAPYTDSLPRGLQGNKGLTSIGQLALVEEGGSLCKGLEQWAEQAAEEEKEVWATLELTILSPDLLLLQKPCLHERPCTYRARDPGVGLVPPSFSLPPPVIRSCQFLLLNISGHSPSPPPTTAPLFSPAPPTQTPFLRRVAREKLLQQKSGHGTPVRTFQRSPVHLHKVQTSSWGKSSS